MDRKKGRPPTRPGTLKDGYYIEVRNAGESSGIKIRRNTENEMNILAEEYGKTKVVVVLGEYKNGKPAKPNKSGKK